MHMIFEVREHTDPDRLSKKWRAEGGGDKRRQAADIASAVERWQRYKKAKV